MYFTRIYTFLTRKQKFLVKVRSNTRVRKVSLVPTCCFCLFEYVVQLVLFLANTTLILSRYFSDNFYLVVSVVLFLLLSNYYIVSCNYYALCRNCTMNCMHWTELNKIVDVKPKKRILQMLLRKVIYPHIFILSSIFFT